MAWTLFRPFSDGVPCHPVDVFHSFEQELRVCTWGGQDCGGEGTLRCEYVHVLFASHSYLARSWEDILYDVSEMV